jgi:hypothetical protein
MSTVHDNHEDIVLDFLGMPPEIEAGNIFPIEWHEETPQLTDIYEKAKRDAWNPSHLPWNELDPGEWNEQERLGMMYWFGVLANFDASGPAVFAKAMVRSYELHEEDPVRRCLFSVVRDEQNHEEVCGRMIQTMREGGPIGFQPKTELEYLAVRNLNWLYYNGARYWNGYSKALYKYPLAILFSSFLMGEVASSTLFHHMFKHSTHPVFQQAFRNIGKDEARHQAICMRMLENHFKTISAEEKQLVTRQLRAGFVFLSMILFEPPDQFWIIPPDFADVHHKMEDIARGAGLGVATLEQKTENWRQAMLKMKTIVEKHGIAFPAMPEVGISGEEVANFSEEDLIPVF